MRHDATEALPGAAFVMPRGQAAHEIEPDDAQAPEDASFIHVRSAVPKKPRSHMKVA